MSMSIIQLIVNALLTIFLPFAIGFVYWHARGLTQRLPENQRHALEQFTRMAVQYVECEHQETSDKHGLAVSFTVELFNAFNLPIPRRSVIDLAVGSALYEASQQHR